MYHSGASPRFLFTYITIVLRFARFTFQIRMADKYDMPALFIHAKLY